MTRSFSADRGVPYFAAFLDLVRKKVVVVGGGHVATSKVRALLPCQPEPLVVLAPHASAFIRHAAAAGQLDWRPRAYAAQDLRDAALAFGATDQHDVNAQVAADARRLGVPVLAVDDVPNCDFIAPALVRRGELTVAISTSGRSPAMARRTRERLERALPGRWGDLLEVAADVRERLGATRPLIDADRWQMAMDGDVERLAEAGALDRAAEVLLHKLERSLFEPDAATRGLVSLVGAGPGDPELLTLRAVRRLQTAEAVVHDRLVSAEVLEGLAFEVVPGISAALAAPAAAGIPVTHRGLSGSVTFVNGHDMDQHDWSVLARAGGTLVFLMAVEHLEEIVARLRAHGRAAVEPAAIVQWATTPRQRILTAPLAEIAATTRAAGVGAPAILVVGPTAALSAELGAGGAPAQARRRTATTLPKPVESGLEPAVGGLARVPDLQRKVVAFLEGRRTTELADLVARHNGVPLAAPCLREVHRPDAPSLQAAVARVCTADLAVAIFLTGVGTTTVFEAARRMGREADLRRKLAQALVVVRGPKPTAVLRKLEVRIDITAPPPNTTTEVLQSLESADVRGRSVALQLYGEPNPALCVALRGRGANVLELAPYVWDRPVDPAPILRLLDALDAGAVDALLITSQAQVDNLFGVAGDYGRTPKLGNVAIGAQGPVAEAALERRGLHAAFRPAHGHMGALVLAAAEFYSQASPALSQRERHIPPPKEN
ncbi:MAG: uroporphyrinogen-III synthase [Chloroflexi bacterium]|nr:uroporphyrinogen-III synthase [Chloroflexota bacterium]